MTPKETEELFKKIKNEVRKIEGVSGCGGNLHFPERKIIVYLEIDTKEVKEAVLEQIETLINRRLPGYEVEFKKTGKIVTGS